MVNPTPQSVFLEHEAWLRTVVRSRLREPEAVEDVMQNIALAIVRHRDSLAEVSRQAAWLYQIAVRQVLLYRRTTGRRRKFRERISDDPSAVSGEPTATPVQTVLAGEDQAAVRAAMDGLGELDRQILMLKYTEGWTYRDLADHLGVSEDTVEYRLQKARRNLKRKLAGHFQERVK